MITASVVLFNNSVNDTIRIAKCVIDTEVIEKLYIIDNSPTMVLKFISKMSNKIDYIKHVNTGYGASHNIALKKAIEIGSIYHIVLNPDISFNPQIVQQLSDFMDINPDTVYLLPKVIYPNGEMQYLCKLLPTPFDLIFRRFFPNTGFIKKKNDKYVLLQSSYDKIINPPCLSGCFMFLRVKTLATYNVFFDEKFFMYCEDFDIIRRLHRVGKTLYYPEVTIVHDHTKASYKSVKMLYEHIKSAIKYFNKYGWFFDKERQLMNNKICNEIDELHK